MVFRLYIFLIATLSCISVFGLLDDEIFEHDPQVAMWCGKLNQHKDIKTGKWVSSKNATDTCKTEKIDILSYCQKVYPKLDIRNIVEANQRVMIAQWCDPAIKMCSGIKKVVPYRCLVGEFEADALLVPDGCKFGHLHKSDKCKSHDQWKVKAAAKCKEQGKHLHGYGVLLPCDVDRFTGVEFVCCPRKHKKTKTMEPTSTEAETPTSTSSDLEKLVAKFEKSVPEKSVGCNRKQYHVKRQKMEDNHRKQVSAAIKHWKDAEKRYNVIKKDDSDQAESMIKGVMEQFKKSVASLEQQAKLERQRLHEEHHQCVQIDVNNKKHKAMKDFVKSMKATTRDPNKILEAVQRFVKVCTQDRLHNLRHFEFVKKHSPKRVEELRGVLQRHLELINRHVNESMVLLYKLPEIAQHFRFILPDWAPKPPSPPTENPELSSTSVTEGAVPTELPTKVHHEEAHKPSTKQQTLSKKSKEILTELNAGTDNDVFTTVTPTTEDDEGEPEINEHGVPSLYASQYFGKPNPPPRKPKRDWGKRSPTTLAAVIGLSCGALVIMVIIIIAMAVRRTGGTRGPTKTVLVDPDNQNSDKQHILEMQKNGYENPTYKFFDY